jgi:hypothetical protein
VNSWQAASRLEYVRQFPGEPGRPSHARRYVWLLS